MLELITGLFITGMIGFGGGRSTITLFLDAVVQFNWMPVDRFWEIVSLCQITPGVVSVNLASMIGYELFGILGSIVAVMSFTAPSVVVILTLSYLVKKYKEENFMKIILMVIRPIPIILLTATLWKMSLKVLSGILYEDLTSVVLFAIYILCIKRTKINVIYASLAIGLLFTFIN